MRSRRRLLPETSVLAPPCLSLFLVNWSVEIAAELAGSGSESDSRSGVSSRTASARADPPLAHPGEDDPLPSQADDASDALGSSTRGLMIAPARSAACSRTATPRERRSTCGPPPPRPRPVAPLDDVQIDLEDARLGQRRFQAARDDQLAQLPERIVRRRQIEVLRQLLRDRAGAATAPAPSKLSRIDLRISSRSIPSCSKNALSSATSTARFRFGEMRE